MSSEDAKLISEAIINMSSAGLLVLFMWTQLSWYRKMIEDMIEFIKELAQKDKGE